MTVSLYMSTCIHHLLEWGQMALRCEFHKQGLYLRWVAVGSRGADVVKGSERTVEVLPAVARWLAERTLLSMSLLPRLLRASGDVIPLPPLLHACRGDSLRTYLTIQ